MKIAILGAGGGGGYYGGLLARNGQQVCVLARTSNLAALQPKLEFSCTPENLELLFANRLFAIV